MKKRVLSLAFAILIAISALYLSSCNQQGLATEKQSVIPTPLGDLTLTFNQVTPSDNVALLSEGKVKVMSINVYLNDSALHAPGMMKLIAEADPDSIGVQEFMGEWLPSFRNNLEQYDFVGYDVNGDQIKYTDADYIFFKKDKYRCIEWDTIWLTDDPYFPSGNPEINNKRRTCTWAVLEDIETGFRYAHVNTHLESASDEVNARQMPMVRDMVLRFMEVGLPVFATGDFNTREGSDTYAMMVTDTGIADTKFLAEDTMDVGTIHGLGEYRPTTGLPIDFCFTAEEYVTVNKYEVIETYVDGMYVSDHNAVMATATIKPLPDQLMLTPNLPVEGITAKLISNRPYVADISFTQADDVMHTVAYRVWAEDKNGNEIVFREVQSYNIDKNRPDVLNCTLSGLEPATEYTVYIAPLSIIGTYGDSLSFALTTPEK